MLRGLFNHYIERGLHLIVLFFTGVITINALLSNDSCLICHVPVLIISAIGTVVFNGLLNEG